MEKVKVSGDFFAPRRDFDLGAFLGEAFQVSMGETREEVAIRFDANQAPYIRDRTFHPSQTVSEEKGGGLTLRFTTSGLDGVARWVLQYGAHAEVLSPKPLRDTVAREVRAMGQQYSGRSFKPGK